MKKKIFILLSALILIMPFSYIYATNENELNLYSDAAILMDFNTGCVLYDKNANEKMYPASTTKILTAIIALEHCNLNDLVTAHDSALSAIPAGYSSAYLSDGEIMSVYDLLSVFLIHSANDAGYVLAEHISGSIEEFANLMNEKVEEIGCKNTHFTNPSGIHNDEHYSTAYDLSLIARYCMKNPTFRKLVSSESCSINSTNKSDVRKYTNTNDLINPSSKYYLEECIGIKTGYTSEAKNCLISACSKDGLELISVVLGCNLLESGESSRYIDSIALFNYGYSNYSLKTIAKQNDVIKTITIPNGSKDTKDLDLILEEDLTVLVQNSDENPAFKISIDETLEAPIADKSIVGTITYTIGDVSVSKNLLTSHEVVQTNDFIIIISVIMILIIFLILSIFLIFKIFSNKKTKYKNRKKHNRKV